jgi:mannitol/fructose-specific phosphotransferase system IIA component (Ntr-type)
LATSNIFLASTGIGDGLALPQARNALGDVLQRPIIVFGRHAQGIAYGSIDGNPVRLFFLLVAAVNLTQHLHLLARLSRNSARP